jgi:hypothetical protein
VEEVEEPIVVLRAAHEEVPRHADPEERRPDPAPDLHRDHGEGDRDAPPPVEDLREQRAGGRVVGVPLAGEAQRPAQVADDGLRVGPGHPCGQLVEPGPLGVDVEAGQGVGGHEEAGLVEGHPVAGGHHLGEALGGVGGHRRTLTGDTLPACGTPGRTRRPPPTSRPWSWPAPAR